VSLRCRDTANGKLVSEHLEPFTETVWPGQETVLLLPVRLPSVPGRYVLELEIAHDGRRFGGGDRRQITVYPQRAASVNGALEAITEAVQATRGADAADRRRDQYEAAAAELRATRRYRVVDALTRPASRRPRGEAR
jgi:hypothetical protein